MKNTIISIIVAVLLIGGAIILTKKDNSPTLNQVQQENKNINNPNSATASVVVNTVKDEPEKKTEIKTEASNNKTQIIEITAKGGYTPRSSIAKANVPTILRINTNGTFDCSSSVRIPSLGIFQNLPQSGVTDINLGTNGAGKLYGTCGMGMYPFEINFQ